MYDAMLAESVTITGHDGDEIEAYSARTLRAGPVGGVVVIHHLPGYDRQTEEFTRGFAAGGLNAVMPNLYHREAPGAAPDDAMAAARASGAIPIPDERIVGEVAGAASYLRGLSNSNGKIGVIGHCSGGRQSFLAAISLPLDAAVDCYGGFVVETPPEGHPLHGSPALVTRAGDLTCPLLGLFGADDQHPSPEHVAENIAAAALELWRPHLAGAVVAIGNAPTALFRLLEMLDEGVAKPALILGFPVGFVGAAEAKAALAADSRGVPFVALSGRRGGSAIAAAAVNALSAEAE